MDTLSTAVNLISDLKEHLTEAHQDEIDNEHYGDSSCSYCETIEEAQAFIDKIIEPATKPMTFSLALQEAQDAFWAKVAECYPEIKTGDFAPEDTRMFNQATTRALREWLWANGPKEHVKDEDCAPYLIDEYCAACGVGHGGDCACGGSAFHKPGCPESDAEAKCPECERSYGPHYTGPCKH